MDTIIIKCRNASMTWPDTWCTTAKSVSKIMETIDHKIALFDCGKTIEERCGGATITLMIGDKHIHLYLGIPESLNKEVAVIREEGNYYYADVDFFHYLRELVSTESGSNVHDR